MSNDIYIIIAVLLVISTIIFINYYYGNKAKILRALKELNPSSIIQARENQSVKIIGKVSTNNTFLISPLSQRKCVYYKVHVEKKVSRGKSSHWETIIEDSQANDFMIESQGENAFVKMQNYKSHLIEDSEFESGTFNDATPKLEKYLNSFGEESEGFFGFNKNIRYKEGILEINEAVAVKGIANWKDPKELNIKDNYSKILVLSGNINEHLILTDDTIETKTKHHV